VPYDKNVFFSCKNHASDVIFLESFCFKFTKIKLFNAFKALFLDVIEMIVPPLFIQGRSRTKKRKLD